MFIIFLYFNRLHHKMKNIRDKRSLQRQTWRLNIANRRRRMIIQFFFLISKELIKLKGDTL